MSNYKDAHQPRYHTCSKCGKVDDIFLYSQRHPLYRTMRMHQLCYDCAYWVTYIQEPFHNTYIINGGVYQLQLAEKPIRKNCNIPGITYLIEADSKKTHVATNVTLCGKIPSDFKPKLPDQFKFISQDIYERIQEYNADMCISKGCYDRYNCLWYNKEIAEPNGPWNKIPPTYKTGGEECPSFINKHEIYDSL